MNTAELQMVKFWGQDIMKQRIHENLRLLFEGPLTRRGYFFIHKSSVKDYGWQFEAVCDARCYRIEKLTGDFSDHLKIIL